MHQIVSYFLKGVNLPYFFAMNLPVAREKIAEIAEIIESIHPEAFLVAVTYKDGTPGKLLVKVDTDTGISLDACAKISRALGKWLEEADPIKGKYTLEVSSPGVGAPLVLPRQYKNNVGRHLRATLLEGTTTAGRLVKVDEAGITLDLADKGEKKKPTGKKTRPGKEATKEVTYLFEDIKEARIFIV